MGKQGHNVATPFGRGFTYFGGNVPDSAQWVQSANIEGIESEFDDLEPQTVPKQIVKRSIRPQRCIIVRNAATIALKPSRAVVWQTAYRNKRVDGYQHVQSGPVAGVVDEHLPAAGVAVGDLFWLVIGGQVLGTAKASTAVTAGARLQASTGTSSLNDDAGRLEDTALTDGTTDPTFGAQANLCGRAVSSRATDSASRLFLAELTLV